MKVSLSWLKAYVSIQMDVDRLADALTMAGLEVETVFDRYAYLNDVVVGRIVDVRPHPDADQLKLCDVDTGGRTLAVVCGAPNVAASMLAPVALPGTVFPDGSLLERSVIRGQASEGMLGSEAELGLGTDRSGIMVLSPSLSVGETLAQALELSDPVFEIDLTPNRPDCLSIIGIAREIAAIQKTDVHYPDIKLPDAGDDIHAHTSVTLEAPEHCPRYAARLLVDIKVGPSPFWLQDRLMSVGLRPINNIVDITNFVLMETGQPLHAFDFDRLGGNRIVVRTAKAGETFTTLDGKDRTLAPDMLMICDAEKPVAVGGVMGGLNSEIEASTGRVLIESAYFDPVSIRKTSKRLGLNTEASHRFERGVDPDGTIFALNRATQLMAEIGGGRLIDGIIDEYPEPLHRKGVRLSVKDANRLLGIRLGLDDIQGLLQSIEFDVEREDFDVLRVVPPSFRVDVCRPVDLMEEVARLAGYDNVPTTFPLIPAEAGPPARNLELRNKIKKRMNGFGFTEAINYSFIDKASCDNLRLAPDDARRNLVSIANPLTEDQAVMRTSLVPGLLRTMHRNTSQQNRNLKLFEIGKIFIGTHPEKLPEEIEMLAGLWTGSRVESSWQTKEVECDFYDIKGVIEGLLSGLHVDDIRFARIPGDSCTYTKPGYSADIFVGSQRIGLVGELHPQTLQNFDLKQRAFIFELNLNLLILRIPDIKLSQPIPKFPAAARDITLIVDRDIESIKILECVKGAREELVESLHLFDVYEGEPIPSGRKSISFRITYRSSEATLEDETVNSVHKRITAMLLKAFGATLPA